LKGLHQKRPDGSVEIFGLKQSKALKLKLNLDPATTTPLELLREVYCADSLPVDTRVAAALGAAPYVHPRVVMIAPMNGPQTINIVGGLPPIPGTDTVFPKETPPTSIGLPLPEQPASEPESELEMWS
jgi:hypothetical protein